MKSMWQQLMRPFLSACLLVCLSVSVCLHISLHRVSCVLPFCYNLYCPKFDTGSFWLVWQQRKSKRCFIRAALAPVIQGCPDFDQIGSDWFPPLGLWCQSAFRIVFSVSQTWSWDLQVDSPGLVINRGEGARAATKQQSALDFSRCGLEDWVRNLKRLLVVVPSPSSVSSMLFVTLLNTWLHLAFPFLPQVLDAHVWSHFPLGCLSQDSILHWNMFKTI